MFDMEKKWDLTANSTISAHSYNLVIGLVLLWGFFVNYLLVTGIDTEWLKTVNRWAIILPYIVSCIAGIWMFTASTNALVSFIGYNLVVVPFGVILNLAVSRYSPTVVANAMLLTGATTAVMMMLGVMYPAFFASIEKGLFWGLLASIVVELVLALVFRMQFGIMDYIVAAIFCGYIGFDWAQAMQRPKTVDNAVDSAAVLYMDIINLFVRLLRILGNK